MIPGAGADLRRLIAAARARGTVPSESLEYLAQAADGSLAVTVVVRLAGLVESEQGRPLLHHEYYFPVPHDEERLALLDFSSPTTTAAPRLGDMFASMAASFHFTEA